MKSPDVHWIDDRLEAFLDGELPEAERAVLDGALRADPAWQAELALARRIRTDLRALPTPACPPAVTEAVLRHARRRSPAAWLERIAEAARRHVAGLWQPSLAMAVLVAVVVAAAFLGRPAPPAPNIASAEVEQALDEVRWTLAYLSEVGRKTGRSVREDVIGQRVVEPMQDALRGPRSLENAR